MRAILPGRPQATRQAVSTVQWDGLRLVAYVSGNTIVILRGPKDILQTITVDHIDALSSVTIDESAGRLAVCDKRRVLVFSPIGKDEGDLRWTQVHDIEIADDERIQSLSWGSSEELLVGGTQLWLYHLPFSDAPRIIWQQAVANDVEMAYFSNGAELIASCGQHDRLVKIWRRISFELDSTRFDVSYLPHPAAVTNLHWRKPWHAEQNLDDLLYTFCADNHIRLWTYSDPHSISVVQLIATIDAGTSIEPRRRSVGSMSRKRHAFVIDSRDFAQTTEKAIQQASSQQVDHALEHLVEIANQSPEICVVLDGLGHMSVWAVENAGCKSRKPTSVLNVALVDDVRMQLDFPESRNEDYVRFCVFGGGTDPASLSLLVHTYTGQIDWYESQIASFLDTSARKDRVKLMSSLSGHDTPIDHIARSKSGENILSWAQEGEAILWQQTQTGAIRRKCEIDISQETIGVLLLDDTNYLLTLHSDHVDLWDLRHFHGQKLCTSSGFDAKPRSIRQLLVSGDNMEHSYFSIGFTNSTCELWQVHLAPRHDQASRANSHQPRLSKLLDLGKSQDLPLSNISCDMVAYSATGDHLSAAVELAYISEYGNLNVSGSYTFHTDSVGSWHRTSYFETNIHNVCLARATAAGKCALVTEDAKKLYIWDLNQGTCEWQHSFDGPDQVHRMVWHYSATQGLKLFVSTSYHAFIISQLHYPAVSIQQDPWCITQSLSIRDFTTTSVGDVCWLHNGDIAISAGNQIFTLESSLGKSELPFLGEFLDSTRTSATAIQNQLTTCTLPLFHADFLEALLLDGGRKEVQKIFIELYERLKYFVEGDELPSDIGFSAYHHLCSVAKEGIDNKMEMNGDAAAELEEMKRPFNDYLRDAEIWQVDQRIQQRISVVMEGLILANKHSKSLDENALRYLYALRCTPQTQDLPWSAYVFASMSVSQEAILDLILRQYDGKITWEIARRTGMFVWLNDKIALQTQLENVARTEYTRHEDRNPVDCSLYYLALNKKSVLQSLWRMTLGVREKENTMKLLANNFDQQRWKETALKNAYALLSKRRFEYAAAFFLLGSSLKDAVNICVNQLHDIQLAIAITRVWDKDIEQADQVLGSLLRTHVLRRAVDDEQGRWMAAWAYTTLKEDIRALQVLVRPVWEVIGADLDQFKGPVNSMSFRADDPHLTLLYIQIRATLVTQKQWIPDTLTQREEWNFVMRNVQWWTRAGMHVLALRLVRNWTFIPHQRPRASIASPITVTAKDNEEDTSGIAVSEQQQDTEQKQQQKKKPPPTQFVEPSADSLLDSFGF